MVSQGVGCWAFFGEEGGGCASIIKTIFGTKLSSQISFVLQSINQSINQSSKRVWWSYEKYCGGGVGGGDVWVSKLHSQLICAFARNVYLWHVI